MTEPGRTVVLLAMEPEVAALRARMSNVSESSEHGMTLARGELAGRPVTAVLCGVGKVAAATAAAAVALTERPRVLISAGVAGAVSPDVGTGSMVVVAGAVEHDYDLRPFVRDRARDFRGPRVWQASGDTVTALLAAARLTGDAVVPRVAVLEAWTASGDHVVTDRERHGAIRELGASVACVDMETSAVAFVAAAFGIAWAGLRVISDGADEHLAADPVLSRALDAGVLLADVLEHYLAAM
jgi:adenosylhomocysteine nucleosidase